MHFRDRLTHMHLTDDQVDRLLTGAIEPDDAPPGYAEATAVLRAARGPAESGELTGHQAAVAALTAAQVAEHMETNVIKLNPSTRRVPTRAAAAAAVVVLLGAGGAAAAMNLLPAGGTAKIVMASDTTTSLVEATSTTSTSVLGETTTTTVGTTTTTVGTATTTVEPQGAGPDATGPAAFGLCNAFGDRTSIPGKSVAATNLANAAAAAGKTVPEYCAPIIAAKHPTTTVPGGTTTVTSPGKSGEAHGQPTTAPGKSGSAPGHSTTTTP